MSVKPSTSILALLLAMAVWPASGGIALALSEKEEADQLEKAFAAQAKGTVNAVDSANNGEGSKSWTSAERPSEGDSGFLGGLKWQDHHVGKGYVVRTGKIYGRWVAAMQFVKDGQVVLTEYTPPYEYIDVIDPLSGRQASKIFAEDVNHDGVMEIALLHRKLNDRNYHMYTVYALDQPGPKLLWKSGGGLGDWLREAEEGKPAGAYYKATVTHK